MTVYCYFRKICVSLFILNHLFIYMYYLSLCTVYINFSMFSFFYLFVYANVYFLYINIWFLFFLFSYSHLHLHYIYIYICIFNYINYIFIQNSKEIVPNKSIKLRVGWKNLCMLNDFKESDKIVCEVGVNILNY